MLANLHRRARRRAHLPADLRLRPLSVGIFGTRRGRSAKQATAPAEAKYQDPKTGTTWSGRGRAPAWIK
ncbi:H-NS histone family protein [Burkholderia ambifaria]|uniref:H-NS histone family protein n=1 Tax=Burkholderia ambifaria TaxID=152480 RepID=UPI00158E4CC5|nr:H-NS histone family protein [Burkholderia ambifaria]